MRWRLGIFSNTPFFTRSKNHSDHGARTSTRNVLVEGNHQQRCRDPATLLPSIDVGAPRQQADPSSEIAVSATSIAGDVTEEMGVNPRSEVPCRGRREVRVNTTVVVENVENDYCADVGVRQPRTGGEGGDDLSLSVSCAASRQRRSPSSAAAGDGDVTTVGACHDDSVFGSGFAAGCTCSSSVAESTSDRNEWRQVEEDDDSSVYFSTSHDNESSIAAGDYGRDNMATGLGVEEAGSSTVVPHREQQPTTQVEEERSISIPAAGVVVAAPPGSLQEAGARTVQTEDEDRRTVEAELRHYFLGRDGEVFRVNELPCRALGAARICLALLLRATTSSAGEVGITHRTASALTSAATTAGAAELLALARSHLNISTNAGSLLFAWLTDNDFTASWLACTISHDFAYSSSFASSCPLAAEASVEGDRVAIAGTLSPASHEKEEEEAAKAEAAVAAAVLVEACRAWGDVANATKSTACVTVETTAGGGRGDDDDGGASGGARVNTVVSVEEKEEQQKHVISLQLRQAIRSVVARAAHCYGQLVVLGYKEFDVRDSTWHRVGRKNTHFLLAKRSESNGVRITRSVSNATSSTDDGHGKRLLGLECHPLPHETTLTETPTRKAGQPSETTAAAAEVATPTASTPTERVDGETTGAIAFETPTAQSTTVSREDRGITTAPARARGGFDVAMTTTTATTTTTTTAYNCIAAKGRKEKEVARQLGHDDAWEPPYRVRLALSPQQKEAAKFSIETSAGGAEAEVEAEAEEVIQMSCYTDRNADMFQLGRMQGAENDFVVRGPLHRSIPGGKVCGPVSRYALRLLVDRAPPHRCRIFTGGFNGRRCLTLPRASPKWLTVDGEWDAVTAFGVRILKPEIGEWREVTIAGAIRRPRIGRLDTIGELMPEESNELTAGTVIDVGGVQMLYESAESMARLGGIHPSQVIDRLNALDPQCPVQLQPLCFKPWQPPRPPLRETSAAGASPNFDGGDEEGRNGDAEGEAEEADEDEARRLVPHIFPACGHVHGYARQLAWGPCPMCRTPGPLVEIELGSSWAIDREMPTMVFNPCGHVASKEVAERWAETAMPNNAPPDAVYRPICPYCGKPLQRKNGERPYSKIVFAQ